MLLASRSTRLCSRCRNQLRALFDGGLSTPKTLTRERGVAAQQKVNNLTFRRSLTLSTTHRKNQTNTKQDDGDELSGEDRIWAENQKAAIEHIERALGRSIEDAIQEDQLDAAQQQEGKEDVKPTDYTNGEVAETVDSVTATREAGEDSITIARKARQIHGESLPEGVLEEHEYKVYKRMYGEPEPEFDDSRQEENVDEDEIAASSHELLDHEGQPIEYNTATNASETHSERRKRLRAERQRLVEDAEEDDTAELRLDARHGRLQSVVEALGADLISNEDQQDFYDDPEDIEVTARVHPLTALGKFGTSPSTVHLPQDTFIQPMNDVLREYSNKHLKETSERTFGGPGLPNSPLTPLSGKGQRQMPVALEASQFAMGEMEANAFMAVVMPPAYSAITSALTETRKRLGATWLNDLLAKEGGPRVLDVGAGGAGILAWNDIVKAHWQSLHDVDDPPSPPATKAVVLAGSGTLRHRGVALLENTTFIPRLPDYTHTRAAPTLDDDRPGQQRKQFDVIIAPYTLLHLKEDWERKQHVQNLWSLLNSQGGVLILMEKGIARGFEAIAGARELLLERHIATPPGYTTHYTDATSTDGDYIHQKVEGMIIAPCTNHERCPLYKVPGVSKGRKDLCSFQQRYIRPPALQRILGARDRNHDNVDFSYISVMKGRDLRRHEPSDFAHLADPLSAHHLSSTAPTTQPSNTEDWLDRVQEGFAATAPSTGLPEISDTSNSSTIAHLHTVPRLIFPPLKRQGHILLDVCTPLGTIERWTVPRSFSKQAFRDARKARWGDLWVLGAKTRVPRDVKTGGAGSKEERRMTGRNKKVKAARLLEKMQKTNIESDDGLMDDEAADEMNEVDKAIAAESTHTEIEVEPLDDDPAETGGDDMEMPPSVRAAMRRVQAHEKAASSTSATTSSTDKKATPSKRREKRQASAPIPRDSAGEPLDPDLIAEWEDDFELDRATAARAKNKKGGAFDKGGLGKASKGAKREQQKRFYLDSARQAGEEK